VLVLSMKFADIRWRERTMVTSI